LILSFSRCNQTTK